MFGLGVPELLVILVIALVIFGAGKLPEIGSSLGKSIRNFKQAAEAEPPARELPPDQAKTETDIGKDNPNFGGGGNASEKDSGAK